MNSIRLKSMCQGEGAPAHPCLSVGLIFKNISRNCIKWKTASEIWCGPVLLHRAFGSLETVEANCFRSLQFETGYFGLQNCVSMKTWFLNRVVLLRIAYLFLRLSSCLRVDYCLSKVKFSFCLMLCLVALTSFIHLAVQYPFRILHFVFAVLFRFLALQYPFLYIANIFAMARMHYNDICISY